MAKGKYKLERGEVVYYHFDKSKTFKVVGFIGGGSGLVRLQSAEGVIHSGHRSMLERVK